MASKTSTSVDATNTPKRTYQSKFGTVTILDLSNYSEFLQTVRPTLMAAGYWDIITGIRKCPDDATEAAKWTTEAGKAIGILQSSVITDILPSCAPYFTPLDPPGLWNYLATYDKSTNPIYVNRQRQEFDAFSFDEDLNVSKGLLTLRRIQANLATTTNPLSDDALKAKLVSAIPESDYWRPIKVLALRENKSLMDTMNLLEPYQKNGASQPAAGAKIAKDKKDDQKDKGDKSNDKDNSRGRRGRGGHRGGRGRYRSRYRVSKGRQSGRGKRDQESSDQDDDTKPNPKDHTKDRISHDQCAFCRKKGHYQADCRQYKKHQSICLVEQEKGDGKAQGNTVITGRVMSPEQINEAGFNYSMSLCSPTVTNQAQYLFALSQDQESRALASPVLTQAHHATGAQSILDSGATRHFSGIRSDFKTLKHWLNPEPVFVANSGKSEAIGVGSIELQTSHGLVTFDNVWYAPDFGKTRLISI